MAAVEVRACVVAATVLIVKRNVCRTLRTSGGHHAERRIKRTSVEGFRESVAHLELEAMVEAHCSCNSRMLVRSRAIVMPRDADLQATWSGLIAVDRKHLDGSPSGQPQSEITRCPSSSATPPLSRITGVPSVQSIAKNAGSRKLPCSASLLPNPTISIRR